MMTQNEADVAPPTSLKKNFAFSTAYQILILVSPFITAPYVSRVLGADGIGIYSYTRSVQMYFSLFAALGTSVYGARKIARSRDNMEERSRLFWEIELLSITSSSICIGAWFIFIFCIAVNYKIFFLVFTLNILATMLDISWFYAGLEQFKYTVTINSVFRILGIVAQFIFIKDRSDLWIYIAIMVLSNFLGTFSMWIPLKAFLVSVPLKKLRILPHVKETLVYFIPAIATSLYTLLDKVLIAAITRQPEQNGYYEQASQLVNAGKVFAFASLNQVLGIRISYLFKKEKYDEIKNRLKLSTQYILFMGVGTAFGIAACADTFVPWFFGRDYAGAIPVLKMMAPLVFVIGISGCLGSQYYTPAGLRGQSAVFIVVGAALNIILSAIFIPMFKAVGAVIGTFSSEFVIAVLYVAFSRGYLTFAEILKYGWRNMLSGVLMFVIVYLLNFWNVNECLRLPVQIAFGGAIYVLLLFLLRDEFVILGKNRFLLKDMKKGGLDD